MTESTDRTLLEFFNQDDHRLIHKWVHYFDIYERHLGPYKGKAVQLIEFGVFHGGSLQMWKDYFGSAAKICGVDINPACQQLEEDNIRIFIADQSDRQALGAICAQCPKFDIVVDDGGHRMEQQRATFDVLWEHLNDGGVYICEDVHTSYFEDMGGGFRNPNSFIEYTKTLVDQLNAWYSREPQLRVDGFTRSTYAIHYYDSMVVLEKRRITEPYARMKGTPTFALTPAQQGTYDRG